MTVGTLYFALVLGFLPNQVNSIFDNAEMCAIIARDYEEKLLVRAACIPTTYDNVVDSTIQLQQLRVLINGK